MHVGKQRANLAVRFATSFRRVQIFGKRKFSPRADSPDYRVDHSTHAFQATGLDFAGSLFVKGVSKSNKTYILLLTCASSHAAHLELVPNMSVDGFL